MRKRTRRGRGNATQLGGIEVYPVGELDAGKQMGGEHQALYKADGQPDGERYQDAPVEMSAYERPPVRE